MVLQRLVGFHLGGGRHNRQAARDSRAESNYRARAA
eukprot:COSAG02_NODE_63865_length_262_cov_0.631902_1_plen_35_part_10